MKAVIQKYTVQRLGIETGTFWKLSTWRKMFMYVTRNIKSPICIQNHYFTFLKGTAMTIEKLLITDR